MMLMTLHFMSGMPRVGSICLDLEVAHEHVLHELEATCTRTDGWYLGMLMISHFMSAVPRVRGR